MPLPFATDMICNVVRRKSAEFKVKLIAVIIPRSNAIEREMRSSGV
jgi:hypothetical protein